MPAPSRQGRASTKADRALSCHSSVASVCSSFARHFWASSGLDQDSFGTRLESRNKGCEGADRQPRSLVMSRGHCRRLDRPRVIRRCDHQRAGKGCERYSQPLLTVIMVDLDLCRALSGYGFVSQMSSTYRTPIWPASMPMVSVETFVTGTPAEARSISHGTHWLLAMSAGSPL
jgi:hypothetical protein